MSNYVRAENTNADGTISVDLSTNALPIISVGMYGVTDEWVNWLDESLNYDFYYSDDKPIDYGYINFEDAYDNYDEWDRVIADLATPYIEESIQDVLPSAKIKPTGVYHPRYYNFENDTLNFTLTCSADEFNRLRAETVADPDFPRFLKDHYRSYDGFISFMADNLREFEEQELWKQVAQVVAFNLGDSLIFNYNTDLQRNYEEDLYGYFEENWDTLLDGWKETEYEE